MQKWVGKVALVTGASSGIGAAISRSLARDGMKVIGVARNTQAIESLSKEAESSKGSVFAMKCDVTKIKEIDSVFDFIKKNFGGVDVCINNAGFTTSNTLLDGNVEEWRGMLDVNVVALCYCSKLATQSMVDRKIDGHIINISSIAAHMNKILSAANFYAATKHSVKFITEGLRQEMIEKKLKIRVTAVSPGLVETEFSTRAFADKLEMLEMIKASMPSILKAEDIAHVVTYILSASSDVEVNDIIIRPTGDSL